MCSVYYDALKASELRERFQLKFVPELETPVIYPSYPARILGLGKDGEMRMQVARWGLVPRWAKEIKQVRSTFNARAESIAEKPTFREAFRHRRCLMVGSAYFEWTGEPGKMRPVRFSRADGAPLLFAGLWEIWHPRQSLLPEEEVLSCTMATTEPSGFVSRWHDRMPVVLDPEEAMQWLDPQLPLPQAHRLLTPTPEDLLTAEELTREELKAMETKLSA